MKTIRLFTIVTSIFLLSVSCSEEEIPKLQETFTGEELFRGIFLFQGDVAGKLSHYSGILDYFDKFDPEEKEQLVKSRDMVAKKINQMDPSFFGELKSAIQTHDPYEINQVVDKGDKLVVSALILSSAEKDMNNLNKYDFSNEKDIDQFLNDQSYAKLRTNYIPAPDLPVPNILAIILPRPYPIPFPIPRPLPILPRPFPFPDPRLTFDLIQYHYLILPPNLEGLKRELIIGEIAQKF